MEDYIVGLSMIAGALGVAGMLYYSVRWVVADAVDRGGSKTLAVMLVVVFFPIGAWIWVLVRPKFDRKDVVRRLRMELED